jgi:hypothetical protein
VQLSIPLGAPKSNIKPLCQPKSSCLIWERSLKASKLWINICPEFAICYAISELKRKLQLKEYFPNPTQYVINKVVGDLKIKFLGVFDTIKLEARHG